jgi:two-component system response regulator RegA
MTVNEIGHDALPNILLVDDDEILRERLAQAIRARGYEVKTAGSAEEALREVAKESPEMAVLDLKMPGILRSSTAISGDSRAASRSASSALPAVFTS